MTKPSVLITGASGGIGSAIRNQLESSSQYKVIATNSKDFDLNDNLAIDSYFKEVSMSELAAVIFCAGVNEPEPLLQISNEDFQRILAVNVLGHKRILDLTLPWMIKKGGGKVLAISSLYSQRTRAGRWAYSASKATLETLVRSVALEFSKANILANCICPGFILTHLTKKNNSKSEITEIAAKIPLGRLGKPDEIAKLAEFLISEQNTYITGQTIYVDGGISII